MENAKVGFAMTGAFGAFEKSFAALKKLTGQGAEILPIMSFNAASIDSRFGTAQENRARLETLAGRAVLATIAETEPIGPAKMCDVLVVAPCTGNTLAKLALGITDTPVTMACKSHLQRGRPVVLAVSTNDALGVSAQNIGRLFNAKDIYFVPMYQDDPYKRPASLTADFDQLADAIESALSGRQLQPVFG